MGTGWNQHKWRFRDHGCCGKDGFTSKGAEKRCGGRVLVPDEPERLTYDRKQGWLPRVIPMHCNKCEKPYTLWQHTGRVEVRENRP